MNLFNLGRLYSLFNRLWVWWNLHHIEFLLFYINFLINFRRLVRLTYFTNSWFNIKSSRLLYRSWWFLFWSWRLFNRSGRFWNLRWRWLTSIGFLLENWWFFGKFLLLCCIFRSGLFPFRLSCDYWFFGISRCTRSFTWILNLLIKILLLKGFDRRWSALNRIWLLETLRFILFIWLNCINIHGFQRTFYQLWFWSILFLFLYRILIFIRNFFWNTWLIIRFFLLGIWFSFRRIYIRRWVLLLLSNLRSCDERIYFYLILLGRLFLLKSFSRHLKVCKFTMFFNFLLNNLIFLISWFSTLLLALFGRNRHLACMLLIPFRSSSFKLLGTFTHWSVFL